MNYYQTGTNYSHFRLVKGYEDFKYKEFYPDLHSIYECPECRTELFDDMEVAVKFLKGAGAKEVKKQ